MEWSVQGGGGSLLVCTNETGETVTDVEMKLQGRALGGMFARRNWFMKLDEMAGGGAVEAPFRAMTGATTDPPRMEITWTSPAGQRRQVVLDDLPR